jgi:predicted  nucleic acid-binding Zn-ribbon protein
MAEKTATTTSTVEEKLRALYDLQLIDSRIDRIKIVRGELPLEVQDLEDEIEGLTTRLNKLKSEVEELQTEISAKKNAMTDSKSLIKKYEEQQNNVRNNREFDALSKEVEFQNLEIQLAQKRIKEYEAKIDAKSGILKETEDELEGRKADLAAKKKELDEIVGETKREEDILSKFSEDASSKIDDRLLNAYRRIRGGSKNGLAVVPIDREASAGSYIKIPPQRQLDVAARQKIIVDEHSGRILVDKELADEEAEKIDSAILSLLEKVR